MLRIGLTGGIGSGKSTVADQFAAHGVPVIDADEIARCLTQPGTTATEMILAQFGADIADSRGNIDRRALARHVFQNPKERQQLEEILHPRIRDEMQRQQAGLVAPYCLLVIPLLFEAGQQDMVDRVLVVEAETAIRVARVAARDRRSESEIQAILASQLGPEERLDRADDRISNNGDLRGLARQVDALHQKYLALAADRSRHKR